MNAITPPSICPECGYDLEADGYPLEHQHTGTGQTCDFEWIKREGWDAHDGD